VPPFAFKQAIDSVAEKAVVIQPGPSPDPSNRNPSRSGMARRPGQAVRPGRVLGDPKLPLQPTEGERRVNHLQAAPAY
jgi:hypothetical protein